MHNYCTPHIIHGNFENFLIHRCNFILLSRVYCVWQVVKTPTIILNNPVYKGTRSKSFSRSAYRHSVRNFLYSRFDNLRYRNENVRDCRFVFCFVWVWNVVSRSGGKNICSGFESGALRKMIGHNKKKCWRTRENGVIMSFSVSTPHHIQDGPKVGIQ